MNAGPDYDSVRHSSFVIRHSSFDICHFSCRITKTIYLCTPRAISSAGSEHYLDKVGVTGSNPVSPTKPKRKFRLFCVLFNGCVIFILPLKNSTKPREPALAFPFQSGSSTSTAGRFGWNLSKIRGRLFTLHFGECRDIGKFQSNSVNLPFSETLILWLNTFSHGKQSTRRRQWPRFYAKPC